MTLEPQPFPTPLADALCLDGWLVVDKPLGMSSAHVVAVVRRLWGSDKGGRGRGRKRVKVGHAGTLDPQASGVLPLALGHATKTVQFITDSTKIYDFSVAWGVATTTDDAEGEIVTQGGDIPTPEEIQSAIPGFVGQIQQTPPAFSAIKVAGRRAYAMARAGEDVQLAARPVEVHSLEWLGPERDSDLPSNLPADRFRVSCGKGTYVRSLARDLAKALGTWGHVVRLRRLRVGPFTEDMSISLDKLRDLGHSPDRNACLVPIPRALADIPALVVDSLQEQDLRMGRRICASGLHPQVRRGDFVLCLAQNHRLVALAEVIDPNVLAPKKVMNSI